MTFDLHLENVTLTLPSHLDLGLHFQYLVYTDVVMTLTFHLHLQNVLWPWLSPWPLTLTVYFISVFGIYWCSNDLDLLPWPSKCVVTLTYLPSATHITSTQVIMCEKRKLIHSRGNEWRIVINLKMNVNNIRKKWKWNKGRYFLEVT